MNRLARMARTAHRHLRDDRRLTDQDRDHIRHFQTLNTQRTQKGATGMAYFDKQGNKIGVTEWAFIYAADDSILADDTIDGIHVRTKFWGLADRNGNPSQQYKTFVRDADGEEVEDVTYRTEATALLGHAAILESLRSKAPVGGQSC